MTPGDTVRVVQLVLSSRTVAGAEGPKAGDEGRVVRVMHGNGRTWYIVRSAAWLAEFAEEELEASG